MPDLSGYKKSNTGAFIEKDPAAELTYSVNWTDWMPTGTNLATTTFTVNSIDGDPAPLTIGTTAVINNMAVAVISGGTAGNIYTVVNTITTDNSDVDVRRFQIRVVERHL